MHAGFAKGYNGANYRINAYDTKLANASRKRSRIKDPPRATDSPASTI
ncbi:N-acetylmuramidase domain-containing protein [Mesorhizobium sp.]|nr:N-acetylmuramidase domain-containing protein [Mesorhizobium sp.]TIL36889.1 MAG: N-acetylmuramidase family protein [Mesorhizobium sp.]